VQVSAAGDDTFSATVEELRSLGLNSAARKYMVWMDAPAAPYCGIAMMYLDDRPIQENLNNGAAGGTFARVDPPCWGDPSAEAHELIHTLGGVQTSSTHTTGAGHCTDEYRGGQLQ
jgi:hypothetical protein